MNRGVRAVLDHFWQLSAIPRCSGNEAAACAHVLAWARARGFLAGKDAAGNVLVRVPARPGCETAEPVVLQAHLDMVCMKNETSGHDFTRDPVIPRVVDEWLTADGTTLGADNGIGVALALAAAGEPDLPCGELELLFTVDEERGLSGALALTPGFVRGRILLNLDSEDEGVFTIGCAGGQDAHISLPLARMPQQGPGTLLQAELTGLAGGHSGADIHRQRGNANKLLAAILAGWAAEDPDAFSLVDLHGGTVRNAIPARATALLVCRDSGAGVTRLTAGLDCLRCFLPAEERSSARIVCTTPATAANTPLTTAARNSLLTLLGVLPHGVFRMSTESEGVVETSSNLAIVATAAAAAWLEVSLRSLLPEGLALIAEQHRRLAGLAGASCTLTAGYPGWKPDYDAPLVASACAVYRDCFGTEAAVNVIHAGLECGVIGERIPGMQMLSLGPTIRGEHTPAEKLHLPSLDRTWSFLTAFLTRLAAQTGKKAEADDFFA